MNEKKKLTIYEMCVCAIATALMCILSPISVPIGPVPVTLGILAICFSVYLLGMKGALISFTLYLLIGLAGLPVFSNYQGGPAKLVGPTGGYLFGFFFLIIVAGLAFDLTHKPKAVAFFRGLGKSEAMGQFWVNFFQILFVAVGMIIGTAICYAFGTAWFMFQTKNTLEASLALCVIPFIPFDLAKIAIALIVGHAVRFGLKAAHVLPKITW